MSIPASGERCDARTGQTWCAVALLSWAWCLFWKTSFLGGSVPRGAAQSLCRGQQNGGGRLRGLRQDGDGGAVPRPPSSLGPGSRAGDPSGPRISRGPSEHPALILLPSCPGQGPPHGDPSREACPPHKPQGLSHELEPLLIRGRKLPSSRQEGSCQSDLSFGNDLPHSRLRGSDSGARAVSCIVLPKTSGGVNNHIPTTHIRNFTF